LKKEAKTFASLARALGQAARKGEKVFWFFFSKKNRLTSPPQATLEETLTAARPKFPAGFRGARPPHWFDESHNVEAIRGWLSAQLAWDKAFDAIACLRAFVDKHPAHASPLIVLALEYQAAGQKTRAVEAISEALSVDHRDLYGQRIASEISSWAKGVANPDDAMDQHLKTRFCTFPFEMLETTPNGDVYVCCPSWLPVPIGNTGTQSADQIWHSPIADELRSSILDGSYRYCSKMHCSRITNDWLLDVTSPEAQAIIAQPEAAAASGPKQVLLAHDQSCNLACPSCRKDFILANKEQQETLDRVMDNFVMPILRGADYVRVTGSGDPFGSNHFRRVLKAINRTDFPNLSIHLHTNAMLMNERAWTDLGLAGQVALTEVSIDAARAETYSVVRRGGDFGRLLENLAFIASLRQSGEIKSFYISFVVQTMNFREMPEFVELGQKLGADLIMFNMIRNWGTYSRDEFRAHFIGASTHPEYRAFLEVLKSPVLAAKEVMMGNVLGYAQETLVH
jgi:wyosine [tRNA(Phe)-imidazoG37] synthetase (radical SAM superfamily)